MAQMMGRIRNGACACLDCGGDAPRGRAWEKRTWEREVAIDFEPEGARVVAFVEAPDDVD